MSPLSPRAEELIRAGRQAGRATEADCERNLAALQARLTGAVVGSPATAPVPRRAARFVWPMAAVLAAALGAGAALAVAMRKDHRSVPPPDVKPAVQLEVAPAAPKEPSAEQAAPPMVPMAAPSVAEPTAAPPRRAAHDRLAEEVAILSRAASYLEAGRASDALRAVDEHQRKFPNGALTEERYTARIQALCALGRREEAVAELAQLSRLAPESPHLARARRSCAVPSASPPNAPR